MEEKNIQKQNNHNNNKNKNYPNNRGRVKHKRPDYFPPFPKEILDSPISYLELSEGTSSVLLKGGVDTVGKILVRAEKDMYGVQRFNKKNLFELSSALKAKGLYFRPLTEGQDNKPKNDQANDNKPAKDYQNQKEDSSTSQRKEDKPSFSRQDKREDKQFVSRNQEKREDKQSISRNQERRDDKQAKVKEQKDAKPENLEKRDQIKADKKSKGDASFDVYKIFPRPKFVPSPPIPQKTDIFVKFQRGGKWGFKTKAGKEVIPPIYDEVFSFKDDMACVERNQAFGFINRDNELVIPYKYDCASSFSEGLACVSIGEKCGYIDKTGEVIIPFVYDAGTAFVDGTCRVKQNGKWGTYSLETKSVDWTN
jgi:hypothetical protein